MSKAVNKLNSILSRLEKTVQDSIRKNTMQAVGDFTVAIVQKRTRLGYGVAENFSARQKLAPLKNTYVEKRRMFEGLSATTTPKKSNLTRTGQMLESLRVATKPGEVRVFPYGFRDDGKSNADVAQWNAEKRTFANGYTKPSRVFNRVSRLEFKQIVRFYRKTFGDLLKNRKLIQ